MSDIQKVNGGSLIDILHKGKGIDIYKPFNREILWFETHIAGTRHIRNMDQLINKINIGDKVSFFREADNEYDPNAIKVEIESKEKIGYIPMADNPVFARLMDAGKLLYGKIKSYENRGSWKYISLEIYLSE